MTKREAKKRAYHAAGELLYQAARSSEIFMNASDTTEADVRLLVAALNEIAVEMHVKAGKLN